MPRKCAEFASSARAMALRDETIFRASTNVVELCNFQGVIRQKITFSDGEGAPTHLDINGDYLAVATDIGLLKIFQVTRREPKQLGSPGYFRLWVNSQDRPSTLSEVHGLNRSTSLNPIEISGHAIRSIRCNADGTRISILADYVR